MERRLALRLELVDGVGRVEAVVAGRLRVARTAIEPAPGLGRRIAVARPAHALAEKGVELAHVVVVAARRGLDAGVRRVEEHAHVEPRARPVLHFVQPHLGAAMIVQHVGGDRRLRRLELRDRH